MFASVPIFAPPVAIRPPRRNLADMPPKNGEPEVDLDDVKLRDDEVAAALVDTLVELPFRMRFGDVLRAVAMAAAHRERRRCQTTLRMGSIYNKRIVGQLEGQVAARIAAGGRDDGALIKRKIEHVAMAKALEAAVAVVGAPPGACERCGGTKAMPSAMVLPGGQRALVPCSSCVPPNSGAENAPSTASNGSTGTPLGG